MDAKDIEIIRRTRLFAGLSADSTLHLLHGAVPRKHAKGQMIFEQGDGASAVFMQTHFGADSVLDGAFRVLNVT